MLRSCRLYIITTPSAAANYHTWLKLFIQTAGLYMILRHVISASYTKYVFYILEIVCRTFVARNTMRRRTRSLLYGISGTTVRQHMFNAFVKADSYIDFHYNTFTAVLFKKNRHTFFASHFSPIPQQIHDPAVCIVNVAVIAPDCLFMSGIIRIYIYLLKYIKGPMYILFYKCTYIEYRYLCLREHITFRE